MGDSEPLAEVLEEILGELKKVRYAIQNRKATDAGGAFPPNPKAEATRQEDGSWLFALPDNLPWKPCRDGCGVKIAWIQAQFGPRPVQEDGKQHYCPNYIKPGDREAPPSPPADAAKPEEADIPF